MPRDAETWLAERGVERRPLVMATDPADGDRAAKGDRAEDGDRAAGSDRAADGDRTPISGRDREQVTNDAPTPSAAELTTASDDPDVARALAFLRDSTSRAPQAERRLRDKLVARGFDDACVDRAMHAARRRGIVDDPRLAGALVEERRQRGHAAARIRRDLMARGFEPELLDQLLAGAATEDPEAAAFDVARRRADQLRGLDVETAYRRVVGHVRRRGHTDGIARKVAREAVFASREQQQAAEH